MNRLGPLKAAQRRVVVTGKAVAKRFSFHENRSPRAGEPTNDEVQETERNSFDTAAVTEARIEEAQRNAASDEDPQLQARVEKAQLEADELIDADGVSDVVGAAADPAAARWDRRTIKR